MRRPTRSMKNTAGKVKTCGDRRTRGSALSECTLVETQDCLNITRIFFRSWHPWC